MKTFSKIAKLSIIMVMLLSFFTKGIIVSAEVDTNLNGLNQNEIKLETPINTNTIDRKQENYYSDSNLEGSVTQTKNGEVFEGDNPDGFILEVIVNKKKNSLNYLMVSLAFIEQELKSVEVYYYGTDTKLEDTSYTLSGNNISFIGEIDQTLLIKFTTSINDSEKTDEENYKKTYFINILVGAAQYTNELVFCNLSKEVKFSNDLMLKKDKVDISFKVTNVDYKLKEVSQEILIDPNNLAYADIILKVNFLNGQISSSDKEVKLINLSTKKKLLKGTDYSVTIKDGLLEIEFIGAYSNLKDKIKLSYTNKYNIATDLQNGNYPAVHYKVFSESNVVGEYIQDMHHLGDKVYKNGEVSGTYDSVEKVITWEIIANYNEYATNKIEVISNLNNNLKYIDKSHSVSSYSVESDGSLVNTDISPNYSFIQKDDILSFEMINDDDESQDNVYKVIFKTALMGGFVEENYSIKTQILADDLKFIIDKAVEINYGHRHLNKLGRQDKELVNWGIYINRAQSILNNVTLVDTLSEGHYYLKDSFMLYPAVTSTSGQQVADKNNPYKLNKDYTVEIEKSSFTFKFENKDKINSTYILEYKTKLLEPDKSKYISNSAEIIGLDKSKEIVTIKSIPYIEDNKEEIISKGHYTIKKSDIDGNALKDVRFKLYSFNTQKTYKAISDKNGIASFKDIEFGEYLLKEVKTNEGYVIDSDLLSGVKVVVDKESSDINIIHKIINKRSQVKIVNKDQDSLFLSGGNFTLERKIENQYIIIDDNLIVNEQLVIESLPAGNYRLVQNLAPKDYLKNTKELEFTIDLDNNKQVKDKEIVFINYQGKISFNNKDIKGRTLSNNEFTLIKQGDSDKNIIDLSDKDGRVSFNRLAPGTYTLTQSKVVKKYLRNTLLWQINIPSENNNSLAIKLDDFINYQGQVRITNKYKDEYIRNASFNLLNSEKIIIKSFDIEDLDYTISNLSPNTYYIENTKAGDGYKINSELAKFTINKQALNKPEIIDLQINSEKLEEIDEKEEIEEIEVIIDVDENNDDHIIVNTGVSSYTYYYYIILLSFVYLLRVKYKKLLGQ